MRHSNFWIFVVTSLRFLWEGFKALSDFAGRIVSIAELIALLMGLAFLVYAAVHHTSLPPLPIP